MHDVVLSADRTMMSNHHGKEFLGFVATGPPVGIPEFLWMWVAAPKMKVDDEGRVWQAPYGIRKIEAALSDAGFDVATIDPDHLHKHIPGAKVLAIGHHDYFSLGPPSSEWWVLTRKEPVNRKSFIKFMEKPEIRKGKEKGMKIIVGGPAAWQWIWAPEYIDRWGIDCIVDGEADKVIVDLVEKAMNDKDLPLYVQVGVDEVPSLEEIPLIKHASVNGLVEIMRGCPRGCKFCSVTLRPLRCYTLDMIEEELKVNAREGVKGCILHSEDVLLYGADGVKPRPGPLLKLHRLAKKYSNQVGWSHFSLAAVKYAEDNYGLVSRLSEMLREDQDDFIGVEVGVETGSPRLARRIMPAKSLPYPADLWPEVVVDAFAIMHDAHVIPAATLIIGLPEETPDDIIKTIELVEDLKEFRSLIVPMYFVPMGALRGRDWYKVQPTDEQMDLMKICLSHDLYWVEGMIEWYFRNSNPLLRKAVRMFISFVKKVARSHGIAFEEDIRVAVK